MNTFWIFSRVCTIVILVWRCQLWRMGKRLPPLLSPPTIIKDACLEDSEKCIFAIFVTLWCTCISFLPLCLPFWGWRRTLFKRAHIKTTSLLHIFLQFVVRSILVNSKSFWLFTSWANSWGTISTEPTSLQRNTSVRSLAVSRVVVLLNVIRFGTLLPRYSAVDSQHLLEATLKSCYRKGASKRRRIKHFHVPNLLVHAPGQLLHSWWRMMLYMDEPPHLYRRDRNSHLSNLDLHSLNAFKIFPRCMLT